MTPPMALIQKRLALLKDVQKYGLKKRGQAELVAILNGKQVCASKAIKAKCYDCMGYYEDGDDDCKDPTCALYRWMPYRNKGEV
jgi:hypothetical protein